MSDTRRSKLRRSEPKAIYINNTIILVGSELYADRQNKIEKDRLDHYLRHLNKECESKVVQYKKISDKVREDYKRCLITSGKTEPMKEIHHQLPPPPPPLPPQIPIKIINGSPIPVPPQDPPPSVRSSNLRKRLSKHKRATIENSSVKSILQTDSVIMSDMDEVEVMFNDDDLNSDDSNMDENDHKILNYADDTLHTLNLNNSINNIDTQSNLRRSSSVPLDKLTNRQQSVSRQDGRTSKAEENNFGLFLKSNSYLKVNSTGLSFMHEFERVNRKLKAFQERRTSAISSDTNNSSRQVTKRSNTPSNDKKRLPEIITTKTSLNDSLNHSNSFISKTETNFKSASSITTTSRRARNSSSKPKIREFLPSNQQNYLNSSSKSSHLSSSTSTATKLPRSEISTTTTTKSLYSKNINSLQSLQNFKKKQESEAWRIKKEEMRRKNEIYLNELNQKVKSFVSSIKTM